MMPYLDGVADRQRLGMKIKMHRNRAFAGLAKLSTSEVTNGILPVRRGAARHRNDKGALRMNFGMRLRGGLFAALMLVATPVAATLTATLASSPAAAQTVATIEVQGNRRVEVETIRSYFKAGPGGRLDQGAIDDGLKALIETGLFQDVKISNPGGHLLVSVVENPALLPASVASIAGVTALGDDPVANLLSFFRDERLRLDVTAGSAHVL